VVGFDDVPPVIIWLYVLILTAVALSSLTYRENLKNAGKAAQRWLGLP
jgi:hypothetical protein